MLAILVSALLFGFVHPGSKWILAEGLSVLSFCALYLSCRVVLQLPILYFLRSGPRLNQKQILLLVLLGSVGAALHFTEFVGIADGIPVSLVTFLVYTHPVWTLLLSRWINKESWSRESVVKLIVALVGIGLLTGPRWHSVSDLVGCLAPLAAGFFIALWVTLSNLAKKNHLSTLALSFYYDVFALVAVVLSLSLSPTRHQAVSSMGIWGQHPKHWAILIVYSVATAIIPNYLFFWGSGKTNAFAAGLILLLEPVVASTVAWIFFKETLSPSFVFGGLLILASNIKPNFKRFRTKQVAFAEQAL